ncbi:MAG: trigger factor [Hyphomicrobiales bacterium]|nr:trigger factor [Hyphomicrobiales bacterium]
MQVTETLSQGLKREFKVVIPASDLATRLDSQLVEMKDKVRINGFRPGKVPMTHLKRVYGRSVMAEVLQTAINEANRKIVEDNKLKLAMEPKIDFPEDQAEVERALSAEGDLAIKVNLEILPTFDVGSFDDVSIERLKAEIPDEEVQQTLERMAAQNRAFTPKEDGAAAVSGDKVTIDFVGKLGEEEFEGGSGTDIDVILGSASFIPGFEEQLEGAKVDEKREVKVTFPENYTATHLAGREATFDVTVKGVAAPGELAMDEEFAKGFGFDSLDKLKDAVRSNMERDYNKASRDKLKRALLDALDKKYSFDLPEGLVEQEFAGIWQQVENEQRNGGKSFEEEGTTEEAARADYRRIAERRVRLGLVLAEVGQEANVQVTDDEVTQALLERARQFPGQEKAVWDYYRKNPEALAQLRAPVFEEKVVDHIVSKANVTERVVSKDDLFKIEAEDEKPAA